MHLSRAALVALVVSTSAMPVSEKQPQERNRHKSVENAQISGHSQGHDNAEYQGQGDGHHHDTRSSIQGTMGDFQIGPGRIQVRSDGDFPPFGTEDSQVLSQKSGLETQQSNGGNGPMNLGHKLRSLISFQSQGDAQIQKQGLLGQDNLREDSQLQPFQQDWNVRDGSDSSLPTRAERDPLTHQQGFNGQGQIQGQRMKDTHTMGDPNGQPLEDTRIMGDSNGQPMKDTLIMGDYDGGNDQFQPHSDLDKPGSQSAMDKSNTHGQPQNQITKSGSQFRPSQDMNKQGSQSGTTQQQWEGGKPAPLQSQERSLATDWSKLGETTSLASGSGSSSSSGLIHSGDRDVSSKSGLGLTLTQGQGQDQGQGLTLTQVQAQGQQGLGGDVAALRPGDSRGRVQEWPNKPMPSGTRSLECRPATGRGSAMGDFQISQGQGQGQLESQIC